MVKSVFQAGREKAARRKKFLEEAHKEKEQPKSIFQKGREKVKRKKKFTKKVKKEYRKLVKEDIKERIHKLEKQQPSQRGRPAIGAPKDRSKSELYKIAKSIKKRDDRHEPISTFDKKQLKRYVLKYE